MKIVLTAEILTASPVFSGFEGVGAAPLAGGTVATPASGRGFLIFFFPRPGPALAFLLGGGGRLLLTGGVAAMNSLPAAGAASIRVETISPLIRWPSESVTSSVYGLPAASIRLTVALVTVGPWTFSSTVRLAIVTVFFLRFARWETGGESVVRGICFQTLTLNPLSLLSSSFFSGFSGTASTSASSSSGADRL